MTQEQALAEFQAMFPNSTRLSVSRDRWVGANTRNRFYLWDHSEPGPIIATSDRSFEHALAIAKSGNEDFWLEDDSPIEDEVSA